MPAPRLLGWSDTVAATLGIARPLDACGPAAEALTGNRVLPGMQPYAARYGGHQFGQWAGQLGDGRAITLGEVINAAGRSYELQLKGAGPTPYSRRADGRAVLRSSVREFMCSEAMHDLGVPTTRALSLTATGAAVVRDLFYDGIYSYKAGVMKPDRKIFELARTQFDVDPSRTLYIDDLEENVRGAESVGFIGHQYDPARHHLFAEWVKSLSVG